MWDDGDWKSLVLRDSQETRDDEADDQQVRRPIDHRQRRFQHHSRFQEQFETALRRTARIRRSRCNPRDSVL